MAAESLLKPPEGIRAGLGLAWEACPFHTYMSFHHHSIAEGADNLPTLGPEHSPCLDLGLLNLLLFLDCQLDYLS